MTPEQYKILIREAIKSFESGNLTTNGLNLFKTLGYITERQASLNNPTFSGFNEAYITNDKKFDPKKALCDQWVYADLLFQLSKEEVLKQNSLFDTIQVDRTIIETYLFFCIELASSQYTRTELSFITREVNKLFPMPVMILFKHGSTLTLSVINRRLHKRDESKDILEKITLIKDILIPKHESEITHRAHLEILFDLSFDELYRKYQFANFVELHNAWQKTLDIKELNKQFYQKLFNWYLMALREVKYPQMRPKEDIIKDSIHQSESLIRLLTRLLFVWFMKEKGLINPDLFDERKLKNILRNFTGTGGADTIYYKAILQNLFFATLNRPISQRKLINKKKVNNPEYGDPLVYRYESLFAEPLKLLSYFEDIPFLNGGLFDCLDQRKDEENLEEIRLDGFSTYPAKQPVFPDRLFFGEYKNIDFSNDYDDKKKNKVSVFGLIDILHQYKFTIEENTPIEEEVALDPELLGKVFENLLASYNPETQSTARKQTGSFYTPREIVNYMVDESLIAFLKNHIDNEEKLRLLFSYQNCDNGNPFNKKETFVLLKAIDNCKILDPACGSGAFPMGVLHKLIHVLHKLDPDNSQWFEMVINNFPAYMQPEVRKRLQSENWNYVRKLGIIQQCIYGVDIQPIATQIAKLRFFISLLVDQREKPGEENHGFEPLPNLDFKIVTANTLVPAPHSDEELTGLFSGQIDPFFEEFDKLTGLYFTKSDPDDKKELKNQINCLIKKKCEQKIRQLESKFEHDDENASNALKEKYRVFIKEKEKEVELWKSYTHLFKYESVNFFEPRYFFPKVKDGFDVIIGNPPYIAFQRMDRETRDLLWSCKYETFESTGDIYSLFYERGQQILKMNGVLTYITSRQWMQASYGKSLRKFLVDKTDPIQLIDFGQKRIFEGATVFVNILLFKNSSNQNKLLACLIPTDYDLENSDLQAFFKLRNQKISRLTESTWSVSDTRQINEQVEKIGKPLSLWTEVEFFRGITSGLNEAFHIEQPRRNDFIKIDSKYAYIIKPLLRGKDIKRYGYDYNNWYTLFIPWHFPLQEDKTISNSSDKAELEFIKQYPEVYNHLLSYKMDLLNRNKAETGIRYEWYALQRYGADFWENYEKPKIVWIEISDRANYAYDDSGKYLTNSAYFLTCKSDKISLKYLLAILNSKVADFYFSQKTARIAGGRMRYTKQYVEQIPVPEISLEKQKPFIGLVNLILFLKKQQLKDSTDRIISFFFEHVIEVAVIELYFKELIQKEGFEIIRHLRALPSLEENITLDEIRLIYNEFNSVNNPIRNAISTLKNYEPLRTIEAALNRKD